MLNRWTWRTRYSSYLEWSRQNGALVAATGTQQYVLSPIQATNLPTVGLKHTTTKSTVSSRMLHPSTHQTTTTVTLPTMAYTATALPPAGGGGGPDGLYAARDRGFGAGGERRRFGCRVDRLHPPARAATRHRAQVLPGRDTCCAPCLEYTQHSWSRSRQAAQRSTPLQPLPQFRLHNSTNMAEFPPLIRRHSGQLLLGPRPHFPVMVGT